MRTALAVMLIASTAFAQAADAPLDEPGRAIILEQGEFAPYRGVLLDQQEDRRRERSRVRAETKVDIYENGNVILPKGAFVAIVLGAVATAAVISAGVTLAVKK